MDKFSNFENEVLCIVLLAKWESLGGNNSVIKQ